MQKVNPDTRDGRTLRLCREFRSVCKMLNWIGLTFIGWFVSEREFSKSPPVDGVSSAASHHHRGCKHGCGSRRVLNSGRAVAFSGRYWQQTCVARRHTPADASAESASLHSPPARHRPSRRPAAALAQTCLLLASRPPSNFATDASTTALSLLFD